MEGYKVIKEFGDAKKGDIFTKVDDLDMWNLTKEEHKDNYDSCFTMTFCNSTMKELEDNKYVIKFDEDAEADCMCCDCCSKLEKVKDLVNSLIDTYTNDYEELIKNYNEGNVQTCVRVEAETVYHNLNKVLNKIKDLLNE